MGFSNIIENIGMQIVSGSSLVEASINAYPQAYQDAYRTGMNYPIGHSMSMPESMAEFNKKPYATHSIKRKKAQIGKFPWFENESVKNVMAEQAWNAGWQRAVDEQKKRLQAFNATNQPFQSYRR